MSDVLSFAKDSPWLAFFLAYLLAFSIYRIMFGLYRTIMVSRHGWPPAHLDADGDWKPDSSKDDES